MSNALRVLLSTLFVSLVLAGCGNPTPAPDSPTATSPTSATPVAEALASGDPCHIAGQTYCLVNPQVTQGNVAQTICSRGWTKTVRPPVTYTSPLKARQMQAFGLPGSPSGYEEDHRLPLELGGFPGGPGLDEHNLAPEAHPGSAVKDKAENAANHRVCSGESLRQAQTDFVTAFLASWPAFKGGA